MSGSHGLDSDLLFVPAGTLDWEPAVSIGGPSVTGEKDELAGEGLQFFPVGFLQGSTGKVWLSEVWYLEAETLG
jgi:hypothetical protein